MSPTFRPTPAWATPHFVSAIRTSCTRASTKAVADADQEQPVDRGGTPHVQSRRRVAAHGQRSGLPWLLQGRYLFSTVSGFLRYASPAAAGGLVPTRGLLERLVGHASDTVSGRQHAGGNASCSTSRRLEPVSQRRSARLIAARQRGPGAVRARPVAGPSKRHDQLRAPLGRPADGRYGGSGDDGLCAFVNNPAFLSDGTIPDQLAQFQPRFGIAWDVKSNSQTVVRANAGLYYARNNMLSQAGSVTANGLQNQERLAGRHRSRARGGSDAHVAGARRDSAASAGQFPLFTAVRTTASDYHNAKIGTVTSRSNRRWRRLVAVCRLHLVEGRRLEPVSQHQHAGRARRSARS